MAKPNVADRCTSKTPETAATAESLDFEIVVDEEPVSDIKTRELTLEVEEMIAASQEIIRLLEEARPRFDGSELQSMIDVMRAQFSTFIVAARRGAADDPRIYQMLANLYDRVSRHLALALNSKYPREAIGPLFRAKGGTGDIADLLIAGANEARRRAAATRRGRMA